MDDKKIVVLGGGTGQSVLLSGLKKFPFDITAVVSVCDDGKSTGKLREEFNVPAMGDIRRVLIALSETEEVIEKLCNYRFSTNGNFDGHTVGNIILTGLTDIFGSMSEGIKQITKILNLKGTVLPLTDECITLIGEMEDGSIVNGEHNITLSDKKIKRVFYKKQPKVNKEVIKKIKEADAIVLSMGSVFTSIIPNFGITSNLFTQPGETDGFKVSNHINLLNSYLGKKKIDAVITNSEKINKRLLKKYETQEQKDLVLNDEENIKINNIQKPLVTLASDGTLKHDSVKLGLEIMNYLTR